MGCSPNATLRLLLPCLLLAAQFLAFRLGEVKDDCHKLRGELSSSQVRAVHMRAHACVSS